MKKALLISLAMISLNGLGSVSAATSSIDALLKSEVISFFQNEFQVEKQNIQIEILRVGRYAAVDLSKYRLAIRRQSDKKKLGYQTIWVDVFNNEILLKKFPVTLKVSLNIPVLVAKSRIGRKTVLTGDLVRIENRNIIRDWDQVIRSTRELIGLEVKQMIKEGQVIYASLLQRRPLLHKGDKVEIHVGAGALLISTPGIAKENGYLGEKIIVLCEKTRKRLLAVVRSPRLVCIEP